MFASIISPQVALDGIVIGVVYGLLAMSIVLVYRSTRVVNFAVGNIGLVGAGLVVVLNVNYDVPFWLSTAVSLVAGTAFGALVELVVIRRLFRAPRVIVLVATIGVSALALAILTAYPDLLNSGNPFPQALGSSWYLGDTRITGAQAMILITAPLAAVALGWFLNRTMLGRAVRAASANPDLARIRGINPKTISTLVWAVSGLIGTISMILVGSLNGSASALTELGPSTLLRALVAAVIARFQSFRTALLVGIALGFGQSLIRFNFFAQPGLVEILLLGVVLLAVALQSRHSAPERDTAFSFTPRVEAIPERLRQVFWIRHLERFVLLAFLAAAAVLPLFVTQPSRHVLYASIAAWAIVGLSLTVLTGWAGQLSLGQMAFAGIAALVTGGLTRGMIIRWEIAGVRLLNIKVYPIPFAVALFIGALVAAVLAAVIGAGALRLRGLLLAVTTFAFAIAAASWIYRLPMLAGEGGSPRVLRGRLLGIDLASQRTYYYMVLAVLAIVFALVGRLRRSGVGRVTIAVRDNADTASAYTVRPTVAKLRAFALSGFIAGLGGGLLAGALRQAPLGEPFSVTNSLDVVALVVIGGMGSTVGAVIGAVWVIGLPALAPDNDLVPLLTSSLGLLVLLLYFPGGFAQVGYTARAALYRWMESKLPPVAKQSSAIPAVIARGERPVPEVGAVLRAHEITVSFGAVKANAGISLEIRAGEVVGLIGTNGSGKTTFMNAIGGYVPSTGAVELLGNDVSGASAAARARLGFGRTFQAATLFPELTVRETVSVALESHGRSGLLETVAFSPRIRRLERARRQEAAELIDFLGLGRYADRPIAELSTGTRRIVELAGLLALDARILCLDEPTAGVAQREAEAMGPLLLEIRKQLGASMLIIEHDMPLIMGMSDRVYCLELGRVIAEGDPATVRNDPKVIASYLGTDERTIARSGVAVADSERP